MIADEAFIIPKDESNLMEKFGQAGDAVKKVDWRMYDFNIVPVASLD